MDYFEPFKERLTELCKAHHVSSLYAFGSAARNELKADSDSDIDLLVELRPTDPHVWADHYWALEDQLAALFDRPVDLISKRALRNKYFIAAVERTKVKLYEA